MAPGAAHAVRARSISDSTWEEFRQGVAKGVAIGRDGSLRPGPQAVLLAEPDARGVWAIASDGHGGSLFATGDGGLVILRPAGKEAEPSTRATLFDAEVFALAGDGRGNWYAAGAPVGTVVKIPEKGEPRTLFDVPEGVVFALLARPDGTVFAGTGDRGRLYRISPSGEGRVLCASPDLSVRCLAWGSDGKIVAGTDGRGLLELIDPESGDIRVLYEAEEREIVSVVPLPDGSILFGANPGAGGDGGESPSPEASRPRGRAAIASSRGGKGGRRPAGAARAPRSIDTLRTAPCGAIWSCPEKLLHALAPAPDGAVYAATSGEAAVYRLGPDGAEMLLWRAEEQQVLSLWPKAARWSPAPAVRAGSTVSGRRRRRAGPSRPSRSTRVIWRDGACCAGRARPAAARSPRDPHRFHRSAGRFVERLGARGFGRGRRRRRQPPGSILAVALDPAAGHGGKPLDSTGGAQRGRLQPGAPSHRIARFGRRAGLHRKRPVAGWRHADDAQRDRDRLFDPGYERRHGAGRGCSAVGAAHPLRGVGGDGSRR